MKSRSSVTVKMILAIGALGALTGSYWYQANHCAHLDAARDILQGCQQVAAQLEQLRHAPQKARLTTRSSDDLGSVVEKAAADAQLARDHVVRIDPQPAKRSGKSDYLDQDTEVELFSVSLRQLVTFLLNLTGSDGDLAISTLRLQLPHSASDTAGNEMWVANVVLTQRVYAPTNPHR